jgi:hypothetical protein
MSLSAAGSKLSIIHGLGGSLVLPVTTLVMARFASLQARAVPWFVASIIVEGTIPSILAYGTEKSSVAIIMLGIFIALSHGVLGPTYALIQNLAPPSMRAQMMAILLSFANCVTLVVAPQGVGLASDHFSATYGGESLRHSLIPLSWVGFWAALHYWLCARALPTGDS